jgi:signal transduction histidine kinase
MNRLDEAHYEYKLESFKNKWMVFFDQDKIEIIIFNLMSNAFNVLPKTEN